LYVVGGYLKSPKPSNMFSIFSTNINYIIHTILKKLKELLYNFTTKVENNKSLYMFHRDCDPRYATDMKVFYMM
jgi:hypothetical protein